MTNGEKILNAFPNAITRVCKNIGFTYIEVEQNDKWIADFDMEWWNAEYKEPTTKNNLGVDYISRDAVKYYIQAHIHEIITESGIDKNAHTNGVLRALLNGVDTMPSVTPRPCDTCRHYENGCHWLPSITPQEPRWIPVSERLPEELIGVLVDCPTSDNIFCAFLENGKWYIFSPLAAEKLDQVVIAWMPLPKPYRGKG